jgi:hypothetical protein
MQIPIIFQSARLQYNHGILSTFTALTLNITMPNGSAFDVIGGELGLFPNAVGPPGFEPGTKGL